MRLLLIRHGETVDNVAGIYAGVTDSALTNHGVLQANRLGAHLSATGVKAAHIFSSDLQRAYKTAEAIRTAQEPAAKPVIQLSVLREQDFGFYEAKRFIDRPKGSVKNRRELHTDTHKDEPGFVDVETKESMRLRVDTFIDQHLVTLLEETPDDQAVVVVAHGIILNSLWRAILRRFDPMKVTISPGVEGLDRGLEYLAGWSNTGVLNLKTKPGNSKPPLSAPVPLAGNPDILEPLASRSTTIQDLSAPGAALGSVSLDPRSKPPLSSRKPLDMTLVVEAVNSVEHLKGLKKTRGGIGSLKHDSNQKTMDSFFKKKT